MRPALGWRALLAEVVHVHCGAFQINLLLTISDLTDYSNVYIPNVIFRVYISSVYIHTAVEAREVMNHTPEQSWYRL